MGAGEAARAAERAHEADDAMRDIWQWVTEAARRTHASSWDVDRISSDMKRASRASRNLALEVALHEMPDTARAMRKESEACKAAHAGHGDFSALAAMREEVKETADAEGGDIFGSSQLDRLREDAESSLILPRQWP